MDVDLVWLSFLSAALISLGLYFVGVVTNPSSNIDSQEREPEPSWLYQQYLEKKLKQRIRAESLSRTAQEATQKTYGEMLAESERRLSDLRARAYERLERIERTRAERSEAVGERLEQLREKVRRNVRKHRFGQGSERQAEEVKVERLGVIDAMMSDRAADYLDMEDAAPTLTPEGNGYEARFSSLDMD